MIESGASRSKRRWCGDQLRELLDEQQVEKYHQATVELAKHRRILDLFVIPGEVNAKVIDDKDRPHRVLLRIPEIDETSWEKICAELGKSALFCGLFLNGELPEESREIFQGFGTTLIPESLEQIQIVIDGKQEQGVNLFSYAVIDRFIKRVDEDPFLMLHWRGKGREELLRTLRQVRRDISQQGNAASGQQREFDSVSYDLVPQLHESLARYWFQGEGLDELSYDIRADELPAAILKRLDPLPLWGLEDEVDFLVEGAYADIARRAQAFGLGLRPLTKSENSD